MTPTAVMGETASSWICLLLFTLFFTVCIRLRGNLKFVGSLFRDLIVVRERESMFDDTMRETSVIFFMLLLSGCSIGILLLGGVRSFGASVAPGVIDGLIPALPEGEMTAPLVCMLLACIYILVMWICYNMVGRVFTDLQHTWVWVRGFTAGIGLGGILFFPLALMCIAYPERTAEISVVALFMLIIVKITFIVKGFRIFFTESSLWVVFLYYLCSLEIVPLAITFGLAKSLLG